VSRYRSWTNRSKIINHLLTGSAEKAQKCKIAFFVSGGYLYVFIIARVQKRCILSSSFFQYPLVANGAGVGRSVVYPLIYTRWLFYVLCDKFSQLFLTNTLPHKKEKTYNLKIITDFRHLRFVVINSIFILHF